MFFHNTWENGLGPSELLKDLFSCLNEPRLNQLSGKKKKMDQRKKKPAASSQARGQLAAVQMTSYVMPKTIAVSYLCQHIYDTHARTRARLPTHTCLIHFCLIRLSKPIFSCPSFPSVSSC